MTTKSESHADFIKSELSAVPLKPAQPNFTLTTMLISKHETKGEKSSWFGKQKNGESKPYFARVGRLAGSCGNTEHKPRIAQELAKMETLEYPFKKQLSQSSVHGFWDCKKAGSLGLAVPDAGIFGVSFSSTSILNYRVYDISTQSLDDEYLKNIIVNGEWIPDTNVLRDFWVVNEMIFTTHINVKLNNAKKGHAGVKLQDYPVTAGFEYNAAADGSIDIWGAMENGERKPFPFAFRAVRIQYKPDEWELEKMLELGEVRGEHPISAFINEDEDYHIGDFFDESGNELVLVIWDEQSPESS